VLSTPKIAAGSAGVPGHTIIAKELAWQRKLRN
jgi:hypothetical protein